MRVGVTWGKVVSCSSSSFTRYLKQQTVSSAKLPLDTRQLTTLPKREVSSVWLKRQKAQN